MFIRGFFKNVSYLCRKNDRYKDYPSMLPQPVIRNVKEQRMEYILSEMPTGMINKQSYYLLMEVYKVKYLIVLAIVSS